MPDTPPDDDLGPPEETFWQMYNANLEYPIGMLLSVLAHTLVVATLVFMLTVAMSGEDTKPVPIRMVDGGDDDFGQGMKDVGGVPDPVAPGDSTPTIEDFKSLPVPDNTTLPEVIKDIQQKIQLDEDLATTPVTPEKAAAFAGLDAALRDKLMPTGQRKGNVGGTNTGVDGIGADATKARSLRWVMRFRTASGRDYLNQLGGLGAVVIVPIPPENKSAYVFTDLNNPRPGNVVSEAEWQKLAQQIQFCDFKPDSVRQVSTELGVGDMKPHMFWAFFPKSLEARLAAMEKTYQNRPPEAVAETVFQVVVRNGQYDLEVVRQTAK